MVRVIGSAVVMCAVLMPAIVQGHVSIWPRQSAAGATEKYTVRVPTEGKMMTVGADMEAPEGVVIETVAMPAGWTYELKRKDDHIVGISWKMDIKPGEFAEFSFVARNPETRADSSGRCGSVSLTGPFRTLQRDRTAFDRQPSRV